MTNVKTRGCKCGCGQAIETSATYRPGHDAKHVSVLLADLFDCIEVWANDKSEFEDRAKVNRAALPSGALKVKFDSAVSNRMYKMFDRWSIKAEKNQDLPAPFGFHPDDVNY